MSNPTSAAPGHDHGIAFSDALVVWTRIALLSFGGPAGQIALMHRILVEEKRWIGEQRFLHALNYCMLLPGPEAQQLATYIGWLLHKTKGGLAAGVLFILPGLVAVMVLSWLYALYGELALVEALFFGLQAAVLAIVLQAVVRIGARALRGRLAVGLAAAAFIALYVFAVPFPLVIAAAGLIGWLAGRAPAGQAHGPVGARTVTDADSALGVSVPVHARPGLYWALRVAALLLLLWLGPVATLALLAPGQVFTDIATFFSKMAVVTFGGAYAVLAYVAQQAVDGYGWLQPGEMLDGLGMAETTPGPLIMVTQFVGFMGAFRDPGELAPLLGRHAGRAAHHLGHLRAVFFVDLSRRPVYRNAARQPRPDRRAGGDHCSGGWGHSESRGVVRTARTVRQGVDLRPGRACAGPAAARIRCARTPCC